MTKTANARHFSYFFKKPRVSWRKFVEDDKMRAMNQDTSILANLAQVLRERRHASGEQSYVASLYQRGDDAILQKIGEEACELVIAGKNHKPDEVVYEMADLWFHCMVLLEHQGLDYQQILTELGRRFGRSGIEEKQSRRNKDD